MVKVPPLTQKLGLTSAMTRSPWAKSEVSLARVDDHTVKLTVASMPRSLSLP